MSLFDVADTALNLVRTGTLVAFQRATLGPRRRGWSWRAETLACFVQEQFSDVPSDPVALRRHFDSIALPSLFRHRVRCVDTTVAGMKARWFVPRQGAAPDAGPVLLYLHGGGYVFGSCKSHEDFIIRLALAAGVRTLAFEYRLAPEHPHPAALQDAVAGYRWLLDQGVSPTQVVVAGESAGGGLTLTSLCHLRDAGDPLPAAAVGISPWCDVAMRSISVAANEPYDFTTRAQAQVWAGWFLGGADPDRPDISPLTADLTGLPPLLLQVGGAEMLLDEVTELAQRAHRAGVEVTLETWDDMFHIWHFGAIVLPQGAAAIEHIGRFVRHHLSS